MTQGNSIKFILFLYCASHITFSFACLHEPELHDEQARDCSPTPDLCKHSPQMSPLAARIYRKSLTSVPTLDPTLLQPDNQTELNVSNDESSDESSEHSSNSIRKTQPSPQTKPQQHQINLLTPEELEQCTEALKARYCSITKTDQSALNRTVQNYKAFAHTHTKYNCYIANNDARIAPLNHFIATRLPNNPVKITLSQTQNPQYQDIVSAVDEHTIVLYPKFSTLTPDQQEAELKFASAIIEQDDYFWMNVLHRHFKQISPSLQEQPKKDIENLLELLRFVRIQAAFTNAILTTSTKAQACLQKQLQKVTVENQQLAQQASKIIQDSVIDNRISNMVQDTHDYLKRRNEMELQAQKATAAALALSQQPGQTLSKKAGQKRTRK